MVKTNVVSEPKNSSQNWPFDLEPTFLMDASLSMTTVLFCKFGFLLNEAPWIILMAVVYTEAKGDEKKRVAKNLCKL